MIDIKKRYTHIVAIDPGVKTGYAIWNVQEQKFDCFGTKKIHQMIMLLLSYVEGNDLLVRCEDPNQRKWYGNDAYIKQQGAGSIKRDFSIWRDFCDDIGIDFEAVKPESGMTKLDADYIKKLTGISDRTSNHCRDAIMLAYKYQ